MKTTTNTYSIRTTGRGFWKKYFVIVNGTEWDLRDTGRHFAYVTTPEAMAVITMGIDAGWVKRTR